MDTTLAIVVLCILVVLSGMFSAVEAAFLTLSKLRVRKLVKQNKKYSHLVKKIKEDPNRLLITILIGNNIVNISASAIATALAIQHFGSLGVSIATGVMTLLLLTIGELFPKSLAIHHAEGISLYTAGPMLMFQTLILPLVLLFELMTKRLIGDMASARPTVTEDEIKTFAEIGEEVGTIYKEEREMIHNILDLNDIQVKEIMTPKIKIFSMDANMKLSQAMDSLIASTFSRVPLFDGNQDNIVGVLSIRDTMKYMRIKKKDPMLKDIASEPLVVPASKMIDELLREMQEKIKPIAVVVDEYGTLCGLVTLEDILEEIVGEIYDEKEPLKQNIKKLNKNCYAVKGETELEEFNKKFKSNIELNNGFGTISGYVLNELGKIPEEGQELDLPEVRLTVDKVRKNRIVLLKAARQHPKQ
jgi:putative hemolysin